MVFSNMLILMKQPLLAQGKKDPRDSETSDPVSYEPLARGHLSFRPYRCCLKLLQGQSKIEIH